MPQLLPSCLLSLIAALAGVPPAIQIEQGEANEAIQAAIMQAVPGIHAVRLKQAPGAISGTPQKAILVAADRDQATFLIRLSGGGQVRVEAELTLTRIPVVAARNLPRGTVLTEADLATAHLPFCLKQAARCVYDRQALVGRVTQQGIASGAVVTDVAVASGVVVRAREEVAVVLRRPGLELLATGRALGHAREGETVTFRTRSGAIRTGHACGPRRICVE